MTELKQVFDFKSYKDFLKSKAGPAYTRKGVKSSMAKALRCQPTYVSQILNGNAHLSLEQAEILAEHFAMTADQKHFWILLVQKDRAGTQELALYFDRQLRRLLDDRLVLTKRLGTQNSLTPEDQSIYYSSWIYSAIHMAVTIPGLRDPVSIARSLGVGRSRVSEVLDFLVRIGLLTIANGVLAATQASMRIGTDSHHIIKHHTNWRNRATESLDRESLSDLHYSGVVTLSREDVIRLKEKMLEFIDETVKVIRKSGEEELYGFCMDFFNVATKDGIE